MGALRDLRATAAVELRRVRRYHWRRHLLQTADRAIRAATAGLSAAELRAILQGAPPTEQPNPRYRAQAKSFVLHIRPKYYQRASTWFTHTWRLGWLSVFFFAVETVTGILLMVFYAPTPERAYNDMVNILGGVPFGPLVRNLHRLGAEGMVLVVVLHMVRVFFTGAYKGPRRFTWLTGVLLLILTLGLSFSGYLLPWDQLSYWAVTIGVSMAEAVPLFGRELTLLLRGAPDIWANGLLRFYLLHVVALPLLAIVLVSVHYYKVAREHSISLPASVEEGELSPEAKHAAEERIDLIPGLLTHEIALASVAIFLMVVAVATIYSAPLETPADPQVTPLHTQAPWYFLWLQGLLKLGDKTVTGVLVPTAVVVLLFVLPWLDRNPYRLARRRKLGVAMGTIACVTMVLLTYMGTPAFGVETPPAQEILATYAPQAKAGPVRKLPWDELVTAPDGGKKTYLVSYPSAWESDPAYADASRFEFVKGAPTSDLDGFHRLLYQFKADVEAEPALIPPQDAQTPHAVVTVQRLQPKLKWIEMTINWDELVTDPATGNLALKPDNQQSVRLALHQESAYGR